MLIDRRRFVAMLVGAAGAAVSLRSGAQPGARLQRVGWLDYSSAGENLGIFEQAMAARGWVKGRTFALEYRGGEGKPERLAAVAAELARLPADVIVAPGLSEALAASRATGRIPVVMTGVDDPVEQGLVVSLARPGRNVTGLATARKDLSAKLLSLLREALPRATNVAALWDATDPDHRVQLAYMQAGAKTLGLSLAAVEVRQHTDVEPAFAAIRKQGSQALIVPPSSMLIPLWIAELAVKHGLPLASTSPAYVYEGGFIAYTDDWNAVFDRVATFTDRILKGARPADLPVELPTKFRLILNAKTAQALRITIPSSIRVRADTVIE